MLIPPPLRGAFWDSPEKRIERRLRKFEKIAEKIKDYEEVAWNPLYRKAYFDVIKLGREALPYLLRDAKDKEKHWRYRYFAMEFIGAIEDATAEDRREIYRTLLGIIQDESESLEIRKKAVFSLCRSAVRGKGRDEEREDREECVQSLIKLMLDRNQPVKLRWLIIDFIHVFEDLGDVVVDALEKSLKDSNAEIRAISATTLSGIASSGEKKMKEKITDILISHLETERSLLVQEQIISGMKVLKDRRIIPYLLESLKTGRYCSKAQAAELLGMFKVKEAVPLLIEALKEDNRDCMLSGNAAEALGKIGDKRAIKPLIDLLRESKTGTWADAAIALARLNAVEAIGPMMEKFKALKHFDEEIAMALMALNAREAIPLIEERLKEVSHPQAYRGIKEMLEKFKKGEKIEIRR